MVNLILALEAFRLFGAGFFYFAHGALAALVAPSPSGAALALGARLAAEPFFALLAGLLSDRWPRGPLLGLSALGQALLTLGVLALLPSPPLLPLYLAGFLFAALEALRLVAAGALLADLLPQEALARARGRLHAAYTAADLLSDFLSGLLFSRSQTLALGLGGGLLLLAAASYRALPLASPIPRPATGGSLAGLRFLWQSPLLRPLLLLEGALDLAHALLAGLLPFLVLRGLGAAPWVLGLLGSALSLGGALGGLLVGPALARLGRKATLAWALLASALGLLGVALLPSWPFLAAFLLLSGMGGAAFSAVAGAVRLGEAPPELRGRVAGGFLFLTGLLAPLGPLLGGLLADQSLSLPFLLAGLGLLGLAAFARYGGPR
ncbi:hypothetical protein Thermus77359_01670 [Thermus oshimai]|uniref:MFS transporter n=1 Tax=Thermus oshimai TaxID=56957 RepID=UPI0003730158|nr:MFS transporter [Thermus oshimai]